MNIGVVFNQEKHIGGVYQYALSFLQALVEKEGEDLFVFNMSKDFPDEYIMNSKIKIVNLYDGLVQNNQNIYLRRWSLALVIRSILTKIFFRTKIYSLLNKVFSNKEKHFIKTIQQSKIGLLIFLTTDYRSFLTGIPFVAPIHDLAHIFCPEFPEVSINGVGQFRDYSFSQVAKNAYRILADSEIGRDDIAKHYSVDVGKVVSLPLIPPNYLQENLDLKKITEVRKKFSLPDRFLFYPAQFWPHKNHINIVKAINELRNNGVIVNVVFSGDKKVDFGEFDRVFEYVEANGLSKQVFYLGYISNLEISALYNMARALIMPTFFGPTNIPILEAWKMGCPVIYSDIRGCREQAGNAALLVNPRDYYDIAKKISEIYFNDNLYSDLVVKGKKRLLKWTYNDFRSKIYKIIDDFKADYLK